MTTTFSLYRPFGLLRFLLAFLVAFDHCRFIASNDFAHKLTPWLLGNIGVMSFFVLSGFIIAEASDSFYRKREAAFLANRFLRIVPPYVAALLVSILIHHWIADVTELKFIAYSMPPKDMFSVENLGTNLILPFLWYGLNNLQFVPGYPLVRYVWAVSIETHFYIVFAVVCATARRASKPAVTATMWLLVIAAVSGVYHVWRSEWLYSFYFAAYFLLGVFLFRFLKSYKLLDLIGVALSLLFVVRHYFIYSNSTEEAIWGAGTIALVTFLIAFLHRLKLSPKLRKIDSSLGGLSYPLYLNHYAISIAFLSLSEVRNGISFTLCLIASIVLSIAMSMIVEPTTRILRDKLRKTVLE